MRAQALRKRLRTVEAVEGPQVATGFGILEGFLDEALHQRLLLQQFALLGRAPSAQPFGKARVIRPRIHQQGRPLATTALARLAQQLEFPLGAAAVPAPVLQHAHARPQNEHPHVHPAFKVQHHIDALLETCVGLQWQVLPQHRLEPQPSGIAPPQ